MGQIFFPNWTYKLRRREYFTNFIVKIEDKKTKDQFGEIINDILVIFLRVFDLLEVLLGIYILVKNSIMLIKS